MSPAVEQGILIRMKNHANAATGGNKGRGVNRRNKEMTSRPVRKVMLAMKKKPPVCSNLDSSGTTEQTFHSASPREINRIEKENPTSKAEPVRYLGFPVETGVPFNRMLSTSTPDPEKCPIAVSWTDCDAVQAGHGSNTQNKPLLPERKMSKKLVKSNKSLPPPGNIRRHKTDQTLKNKNSSPTNTTNNAVEQQMEVRTEVGSTQTSPGAGVSSSSPSYGNAYIFSVHQINKMSPKPDTDDNQSAFNPVVPLSKHGWQSTTHVSSNTTTVPNPVSQCITPSKVQKPVSEGVPSPVPLTLTESNAPNLHSRQIPPSCANERPTYYPPDLLNYKLPDYSAKPPNNAELVSHLTRNQVPIGEPPPHLNPKHVAFSGRTVINNQTVASHSQEHQPFIDIDTIKDNLQPSAPVSAPNHKIIPPVSSHFFTPINPPQESLANLRVPFEEPVRDNDMQGCSTQLNRPQIVPVCSANSDHAGKSLKEYQGNMRNGSNDDPSPLEYASGDTSKNHQSTPRTNYKENPYIHGCSGNNYDIHLQWQSVEALAGAKTLKFMINELKETCKSTNHPEIIRMVNQLEDIVNTLPQLQDTFDLQTEFCLALQPLRSENNLLHKKLKMLAEEKAQVEKKMEEDHRREILELQLQLLTLEKHVDEEKLQNQLQLHHHKHVIKDLKSEQQCLVKDLGQRDNSQLNLRLKSWEENQMLSKTVKETEDQLVQNSQVLEFSEKKNHILQITVEQRDKEISNLYVLLNSVRGAMQDVLNNINPSNGNTSSTDTLERLFKLFPQEPDSDCTGSVLSACSGSRLMLTKSQQVSLNVATTSRENSSNVASKESVPEKFVNQRLESLLNTMNNATNSVAAAASPVRSTSSLSSSSKHSQPPGDVSVNDFELPNSSVFDDDPRELTDQQNRLRNCQAETEESSALKDNNQQSRPGRDKIFYHNDNLECSFDSQNKVEISYDSRASITEYFQKYPRAKTLKDLVDADSNSNRNYMAESAQPFSFITIRKNVAKEIHCGSDRKGNDDNDNNGDVDYRHDDDDDDITSNLSQYTFNTDSSLNADILNFRNGLASLDAGIAQLEQSIKENK